MIWRLNCGFANREREWVKLSRRWRVRRPVGRACLAVPPLASTTPPVLLTRAGHDGRHVLQCLSPQLGKLGLPAGGFRADPDRRSTGPQ